MRLEQDSEKASMVPAVQLQNLTREARLLNAQNAVLALYCRNYWATNGSEATQIKVSAQRLRSLHVIPRPKTDAQLGACMPETQPSMA